MIPPEIFGVGECGSVQDLESAVVNLATIRQTLCYFIFLRPVTQTVRFESGQQCYVGRDYVFVGVKTVILSLNVCVYIGKQKQKRD